MSSKTISGNPTEDVFTPMCDVEPCDVQTSGRALYGRIVARKYVFLLLCGVALVAALLADIVVGPSGMPVGRVIAAIFAPASVDAPTYVIVWLIRLPAAVMALAVGAGLGVAGAEMQTILGNPLASPYTLGIASGAGFGAALAIVLGVGILPLDAQQFIVPINAFIFALLCSFLVYWIARAKNAAIETIVLTGIALHFLFSSLMALLEYLATQEELHEVVFWLFGSLDKASWPTVGIVAVILAVVLPLFARDAWTLTALRLGDAKAESLGVDVERVRRRVLVMTSVLTAAATCFVGTIGFVGLVAPHMARMLVGEDQRFFMPLTALSGALLLSVASIISKSLVHGAVFPVGIITSFAGIPFFLLLILTRRRRHW